MTLPELLRAGLSDDAEQPALLAPGRPTLSHGQLGEQMATTAGALRRAGIRRHDTVAVVLPNGPELATVTLAVASSEYEPEDQAFIDEASIDLE